MDKKIDETIDLLREQVADNDLHSIILVSPKDGKDAIVALTGTGYELLDGIMAVIDTIAENTDMPISHIMLTLMRMSMKHEEETE